MFNRKIQRQQTIQQLYYLNTSSNWSVVFFSLCTCLLYTVNYARKKNEYCLIRRNKSIAESLSLPPCWLHIQVIRALSKVERHCD